MKKGLKIFLWVSVPLVSVVIGTLGTILTYHYTYKVKDVASSISNNTGIVQASGRGLYDSNGNEIIFRGVNLGGWFVTEGWLEPYATVDATLEERDGEIRPVYYTYNHEGEIRDDKLSQDEMLIALHSNNNLGTTDKEKELVLNDFYDNWISKDDIANIKAMGMNQVRIPVGWRMFLNDDYSSKEASDLDNSLFYLDRCLDWCKEYGIYAVLDLHTCPLSQNGYEHGGTTTWKEGIGGAPHANMWYDEDAINATIKVWEMMVNRYNTKEYKSVVCMYDITNEPRSKEGKTDKTCWDVLDRIYKRIRELNDNHVIIMEGCWDFATLPNPKKYGWENVCYSYHWYNFSPFNKNATQYELYYAYQDMFNIGRDYDVPVYMGEFSLFEESGENEQDTYNRTKDRWFKGLNMWEDRHYSWCIWTYKKVVNGWWGDTWGLYNIKAAENRGDTYDVRVNLSTASKEEIKEAFSSKNIGMEACTPSILQGIITEFIVSRKNTTIWYKPVK